MSASLFRVCGSIGDAIAVLLVDEWIHFTLFGIILPTIKTKRVHFWGLMNSATKF